MDPNAHKKKRLINKYGKDDLMKRLMTEDFERRVVSFYRYVIIQEVDEMRDRLYLLFDELKCLGRIYIAREGINAQMSVPEPLWDAFVEKLYAIEHFKDVPFKAAVENDRFAFLKLTVKIRKNIVADGLPDDAYDVTDVGRHLDAKSWNDMMQLPDATVVDMRNFYESEIGHFEGAILPEAETFREELPEVLHKLKGKEEQPLLLYCTGGIRCEKTSAFLKHHGFKNVNQLHGGIIDYYKQIQEQQLENKFLGKNFVFDGRLGERINEQVISECHQCGTPCDTHVNCANKACNILFIQCENCATEHEKCCSQACIEVIHLPEDEQKEILKQVKQKKIFKRYKKPSVKA